jgi:hypothetical protein
LLRFVLLCVVAVSRLRVRHGLRWLTTLRTNLTTAYRGSVASVPTCMVRCLWLSADVKKTTEKQGRGGRRDYCADGFKDVTDKGVDAHKKV